MKKILAIMILAVIVLSFGYSMNTIPEPKEYKTLDQACKKTGGKVVYKYACLEAENYAQSCSDGAYSCSLEYSHIVKTCECGVGTCWDGTKCVLSPIKPPADL